MNKVREYRLKQSLSQAQLAKAAGVSRMTIYNIESGANKNVKMSTIVSLANALGTTPSKLFF